MILSKTTLAYKIIFGRLLPTLIFFFPSLSTKRIRHEILGNEYGGYAVPLDLIKKDWICYSVGIGDDTSFDRAIIKKYGCQIFAFDPTPKSISYIKSLKSKVKNFRFFPIGIWSKDEKLKFYSPANPTHISHSIHNLQGTDTYFFANCKRLKTIMKKLGHEKIDLLKLDIEGAEFAVLKDMLKSKIYPKVVCAEFDQPYKIFEFVKTLLNLQSHGYRIYSIKGWVYGWTLNV